MTAGVSNRNPSDRNAEATVHIAHLDDKVTDALLWELMVQAGPVRHVYIPRNRITGSHYGYGFCEFNTPLDALYASKVLNMVRLYDKAIRISQSTTDKVSQDIGANLFVGNLVEEVDEKLLHDAFSAFGPLIEAPYIMRNLPSADARRYGFVKYSSFEHADAAIAAMDGQYICNQPISVQFAFKKDSDSRERHGSHAERELAARAAQNAAAASLEDQLVPNKLFADGPSKRKRPTQQPPTQFPAPLPAVSPLPPQHPTNPFHTHKHPQAHMHAHPHVHVHPHPHHHLHQPMHHHYSTYPPRAAAHAPPAYPQMGYRGAVPPPQAWHVPPPVAPPPVAPPPVAPPPYNPPIHPPSGYAPYGVPPAQPVQIGWSRNRTPVTRPPGPLAGGYGRPPPPLSGPGGNGAQPVADEVPPTAKGSSKKTP